MRSSVNETMSDRPDRREQRLCFQLLEQLRDGGRTSDAPFGVFHHSPQERIVDIGDREQRKLERR